MTKPLARKMGRPPSGEPPRRQVFAFVSPDRAAWLMGLAPKERTAWLERMIDTSMDSGADRGAPASPTPPAAQQDAE